METEQQQSMRTWEVTITADDHEIVHETMLDAETQEAAETNALAAYIDCLAATAVEAD